MRDGFRGWRTARTPISTISGSRRTQAASRSISGGSVAEKRSVCRSFEIWSTIRRTSGRNPMSSIRIHDFVEHENTHVAKMERALFEMIKQPAGGGRNHIHAAFQIVALLAVADTAMHDRYCQIGKSAIMREMPSQLAQPAREVGSSTRQRNFPCCPKSVRIHGRANAAVLPAPDLGGSDQVFPGENYRKRAELNRRRLGKTHRLSSANNFWGEAEIVK